MFRIASLILFVALSACSGPAVEPHGAGPCSVDPGGYQCEIRRYGNT